MKLDHLEALSALAGRAAADLAGPVGRYVTAVKDTLAAGRTVFWAGNGGSAAHAQHIATEYVVRYRPVRRKAAPALALSTDSSLLTAGANDLGFEEIFARQIEAHGRKGDLLVLVSTSGRSPNLLAAARAAARSRRCAIWRWSCRRTTLRWRRRSSWRSTTTCARRWSRA